jgi:hypothetical protein
MSHQDNEHKMRHAFVTFANGDQISTYINGTVDTITEYYKIGRKFNIGSVNDNIQAVTGLEVSDIK